MLTDDQPAPQLRARSWRLNFLSRGSRRTATADARRKPTRDCFSKPRSCSGCRAPRTGTRKNVSIFLLAGGQFRLTPLYDVMSAQPNVDAGEIRHNHMKLVMAVGDRRHYTIDSIMPRHFLQPAARCGVSAALVQGILDEIDNDAGRAIGAAVNDLPPKFPEEIVASDRRGHPAASLARS